MNQALQYKHGKSMSFTEHGDRNGYPILIQHGLIASIDDYNLFDRLLKSRVHLICMARPGCGESSPYTMNKFVEWAEIAGVLIDELELSEFDILRTPAWQSWKN